MNGIGRLHLKLFNFEKSNAPWDTLYISNDAIGKVNNLENNRKCFTEKFFERGKWSIRLRVKFCGECHIFEKVHFVGNTRFSSKFDFCILGITSSPEQYGATAIAPLDLQ